MEIFSKDGKKYVKFGPKGKHVEIPAGYDVVETGQVYMGDMFLNLSDGRFQHVEFDDTLIMIKDEDGWTNFDCLIREKKFIV